MAVFAFSALQAERVRVRVARVRVANFFIKYSFIGVIGGQCPFCGNCVERKVFSAVP